LAQVCLFLATSPESLNANCAQLVSQGLVPVLKQLLDQPAQQEDGQDVQDVQDVHTDALFVLKNIAGTDQVYAIVNESETSGPAVGPAGRARTEAAAQEEATANCTKSCVETCANCTAQIVRLLASPDESVQELACWCLGNIAGDGTALRNHLLDFPDFSAWIVKQLEAGVDEQAGVSSLTRITVW
jgi:hypothetical protein